MRYRRRRNGRLQATGSVKAYMALIVLVSLFFTIIPEALFASSWNPALLANTEAFQVIDEVLAVGEIQLTTVHTDSAANIQLKFGDGIGETLTYDRSNRRFKFSRGLFVGGNTIITGSLLVNIGNGSTTAEAALEVPGIISGSTVYTKSFSGAGLTTCSNTTTSKLLWNSTTGQFSCGTDQTGAGGGSFGQYFRLHVVRQKIGMARQHDDRYAEYSKWHHPFGDHYSFAARARHDVRPSPRHYGYGKRHETYHLHE